MIGRDLKRRHMHITPLPLFAHPKLKSHTKLQIRNPTFSLNLNQQSSRSRKKQKQKQKQNKDNKIKQMAVR